MEDLMKYPEHLEKFIQALKELAARLQESNSYCPCEHCLGLDRGLNDAGSDLADILKSYNVWDVEIN